MIFGTDGIDLTQQREAACGSQTKPSRADVLHRLARRWQRRGLLGQAREAYLQAIALQPGRPATYNNLAVLDIATGDLMSAEQWLHAGFEQARNDRQRSAWPLLLNTACQLALQQGRFAYAKQCAQALVKLEPNPRSLTNLAVSQAMVQRPAAAMRSQSLALGQQSPTLAAMQSWTQSELWRASFSPQLSAERHQQLLNLATFALQDDPLLTWGWRLLLASLAGDAQAWNLSPHPWHRLWDGTCVEQLRLWDEQGYGDCLQSLRWLPTAAQRAKRLEIWLRPELLRLVQSRMTLPANCLLIPMAPEQHPWSEGVDAHLPMTALPGLLAGTPMEVQGHPCLNAAQPDSRRRLRLGFAWAAGHKSDPEARRAAELRSVPTKVFLEWIRTLTDSLPELQQQPVDWVSLQVSPDMGPTNRWLQHQGIATLAEHIDWEDTAQQVEQLTAVISVDTAVAHLAGCLGRPTVVLLNRPCDWRWGQNESHTDWYDSWQLARCSQSNDWVGALQIARHRLREILQADALSQQ